MVGVDDVRQDSHRYLRMVSLPVLSLLVLLPHGTSLRGSRSLKSTLDSSGLCQESQTCFGGGTV